jgi:hypothetical protein
LGSGGQGKKERERREKIFKVVESWRREREREGKEMKGRRKRERLTCSNKTE